MIRKHFSVHKLEHDHHLTCEICINVKLNSIKQLKKHASNFHNEHLNGCLINKNTFQCNKCVFFVEDEENELNRIIKHQKKHLKLFETVNCIYCAKEIKSVSNLSSHLRRNHASLFNSIVVNTANQDFVSILSNSEGSNFRNSCSAPMAELDNENILTSNEESENVQINLFYEHLYKFLLKLKTKGISEELSDMIVNEVKTLCEFLFTQCINENRTDNIPCYLRQFKKFDTIPKRRKLFFSDPNYISPVTIALGRNSDNQQCFYQYVPILVSLKNIIQKSSLSGKLRIVNSGSAIDENLMRDFTDGQKYKNNEFFRDTDKIEIILFSDVCNVCNPLGSSKSKHKTNFVYFKLGNIKTEHRSKINDIMLVSICNEKDLKEFKPNVILQRMYQDLKTLEETGLTVNINGQKKLIKGSIFAVAGDNLGAHMLIGLPQNFSTSASICRYCYTSTQSLKKGDFSVKEPRTKESHEKDVENCAGGIETDSILNKLSHFHTSSGFPPCIGHDFFHGAFKSDVFNILEHFINIKTFTAQYLKLYLKSLIAKSYCLKSLIYVNDGKSFNISGSMSEIQNTIIYLPFFFLNFNITGDSHHQFFTIILEITRIINASTISNDQVALLDSLITDYVHLRKDIFKKMTNAPKVHYIVHVPELILKYGPLKRFSTLGFEQKHQFFKQRQQKTKNFVNIQKTLAEHHQLLMLQEFNNQDSGFAVFDPRKIDNDERKKLKLSSNYSVFAKNVSKNFVNYQCGQHICCGLDTDSFLKTMEIVKIIVDISDMKIKFLGYLSKFAYNDTTGLHEKFKTETEKTIIDFADIKLIGSIYVHCHNNRQFISLKESITY